MSKFTQCVLVRDSSVMVSWIPSKFAEEGKIVDLRQEDKSWTRGWKVSQVGSVLDEKEIIRQASDHKNMRKVTDI